MGVKNNAEALAAIAKELEASMTSDYIDRESYSMRVYWLVSIRQTGCSHMATLNSCTRMLPLAWPGVVLTCGAQQSIVRPGCIAGREPSSIHVRWLATCTPSSHDPCSLAVCSN